MKTLAFTLTLAATVATGILAPLPADAGGNALVFQVNPSNRAEARALRRSLAELAGRNDVVVSQNGANNTGAVVQQGRGSTAIIQQQGNGHTGSITQQGNNHAYGLFQFGEATTHQVTQQGRRRAGMTVVIGY